ncbi:MAG: tetratricopeptide repeat protein [Myxococcales bacterium]|nr:tetratricopeptide repeat protein [Myxococcales bacterium]
MLSLLIALVIGAVAFTTGLVFFDPWSGVFLGLAGLVIPLVLIGRKVLRRLEAKNKEAEAHISAQRFDKAIAVFESMRPLGLWFPRLAASMDGQIGVLKYAAQRDFEGARPYLEKAPAKLWMARGMLAAAHFKKHQYDLMEKAFEVAVAKNKEQGLLWAAYAFCELKRGEKAKALNVLQRGVAALPADARLKAHLASLEKGKKPKMSAYGAEWYSFHIETPAMAGQGQPKFMPPPDKIGGGKRMRVRRM